MVKKYLTKDIVDKIIAKMGGIDNKNIPRLLNTAWHDFITESIWQILKKFKPNVIDFYRLKYEATKKIKEFANIRS